MIRLFPLLALMSMLAGCGNDDAAVRDFNTRPVVLPDGTRIVAEVMTRDHDMARGMMFRDSLPEGRGMLFIHGSPGRYSYWMYQVKVPLDIIWMDARGRIVEIAENVPGCPGPSSSCPNYGGTENAMVVLEVPGGYARKHGVRVGNLIQF